jgi:hypothetical protein
MTDLLQSGSVAAPELHLCIVTGQAQANLIPLLMFRPHAIVLIVTPGMASQGKGVAFARTLQAAGVVEDAASVRLIDFPELDYWALEDAACEHLVDLLEQFPDHRIVLNVTGGTKLISQAWLRALGTEETLCSAYYLDTAHNRLEWLQPRRSCEEIPDVLTVSNGLKAQGFTQRKTNSGEPDWVARAQGRRDVTLWLGRNAKNLDWLLSEMNRSLHEYNEQKPPRNVVELKHHVAGKDAAEAFAQLDAARVLDLVSDASPQQFLVPDISGLTYLKGGWIEEYVWWCMQAAGLTDVCCGMDQTSDINPSKNIRNELDVVAAWRNQMLVVECKTAHLGDEATFNKVLYQLSSLGEKTAGIFGQRWLVLGRMPRSGRDAEEREASVEKMRLRAESLGVQLIEPEHLPHLIKLVGQWMTDFRIDLGKLS